VRAVMVRERGCGCAWGGCCWGEWVERLVLLGFVDPFCDPVLVCDEAFVRFWRVVVLCHEEEVLALALGTGTGLAALGKQSMDL
jgi:hypothetical protein